jgi:elongation factor Ts
MAEVTASLIKELRERTQAGMSDCKSALVEAGADMDKAIEIILKKGLAKSAKRAGAAATEGVVCAEVFDDAKSGVIVEVNIQTDFAARNDNFTNFVNQVVSVATKTPHDADLLTQAFNKDKTIDEFRQELSGTIGENIQVRRWKRFDVQGAGFVASYVHLGGKIGVLVEIGTETPELAANAAVRQFAEELTLHIAASPAGFLERSEVDAPSIAKQVDIFEAQLREENKPEAAWPKIIEGKKNKWFGEIVLLEQESVVTTGSTIEKLRAELSKSVGGNVTIRRFARFERGEGIEKKQDDFAAEVAKMAGA